MNSMRKAVLCLSLGLLITPTWADTTSLPLTDDAWINANNPGTNFGLDANIFVHNWGPKEGLVRFDAATISGQTVTSATLELYLNSIAASGEISIHAITWSWSETTVTWNNQPPAEAVATAIVSLTTDDDGGTVEIDVTGAVQRWADGSLADAGFLIVTSDSIKAYFDAKERAGGVPATLTVESEGGVAPPPYDGKPTVLDLSDPDNCTIDESGHYVLDRSWLLYGYETGNMHCAPLVITARFVTLDMRGFFINTDIDEYDDYLPDICITEGAKYVTIRNGSVGQAAGIEVGNVGGDGCNAPGPTVDARVTLENVSGRASLGDNATVIGGRFSANVDFAGLGVGAGSVVRGALLFGGSSSHEAPALYVRGSGSIVSGNTFHGYVYADNVSDTVIINNVFADGGFSSLQDNNTMARNVFLVGYIYIAGTGNIVDGNIIRGGSISFSQPGNFFGNNRVNGPITGTEGQTDWGGNVSF